MSGVEIPLSKTIKAHGADVDALTLREPTTKDLIEIGNPFLIVLGDGSAGSSSVQIQNGQVAKYIVRLAAIPASSVEQLSRSDFSTLSGVVLGFFGTDAGGQVLS
jgi:hypothetical protein